VSTTSFSPVEPLEAPATWLLEASAGTGKTYQIANLFLRLVAEYGRRVERILTITFTNAATAELRERIRLRLLEAVAALRDEEKAQGDEVLLHLVGLGRREELEARLQVALRAFDLAPISTIHAFAHRMLSELAFESGQEPGVELVSSAAELLQELADDSLAHVYAQASAEVLRMYEHASFDRKTLRKLATTMTRPIAPAVRPEGGDNLLEALPAAQALARTTTELAMHWKSEAGRAQVAALSANPELVGREGHRVPGWLPKLQAWLDEGAIDAQKFEAALRNLAPESIRGVWAKVQAKASKPGKSKEKLDAVAVVERGPPELRPWWPLIERLAAFSAEHEAFWTSFAPLAPFARQARGRFRAGLERRNLLTFDGILSRLDERLQEDGRDGELARRIRERFDVVFVDEFQDTDAAQWRSLELVFHGHALMFLIGDPKQAIYAFRGADLDVYKSAAAQVPASHRRSMRDNWRSDPAAVEANNLLFRAGSNAFDQDPSSDDDHRIDYETVRARRSQRLQHHGAGLELRWVDRRVSGGAAGELFTSKKTVPAPQLLARDLEAWLDGRRGTLEGAVPRPSDLAVLVNTHAQAAAVRAALAARRIPAVGESKGSVFASEAASWVARWLDAIAGGSEAAAKALAVTPMIGWTAERLAWALAVAEEGAPALARATAAGLDVALDTWDAWVARLRSACTRFSRRGFAVAFDHDALELEVYPRVLALPDGERHATDLRHLFELLHAEERARRLPPATLAAWLRAKAREEASEHSQRLESDARAVKVETVHVSKGLEYPLVFLPFAWEEPKGKPRAFELVSDREGGYVETSPKDSEALKAAQSARRRAEAKENLRKAYVALTRARHHTVAWTAIAGKMTQGSAPDASALVRLVLRPRVAEAFPELPVHDEGTGQRAEAAIAELAAASDGKIAWVAEEAIAPTAALDGPPRWLEPPRPPDLVAWTSERESLVGRWCVTSYSRLSSHGAPDDKGSKELPEAEFLDELDDAEVEARRAAMLASIEAPQGTIAWPAAETLEVGRGKGFGTFAHEVLEHLDLSTGEPAPGAPAPTRDALALRLAVKHGVQAAHAEAFSAWIPKVLETPLDADRDCLQLPRGFTLGAVALRDRLPELDFDLRLGAGTDYVRGPGGEAGRVDPAAILAALAEQRDTEGIAAWLGAQLRAGSPIGALAGILTGSIDLVFRVGAGREARYYLADHKTDRVGEGKAVNFSGPWMSFHMARTNYLLQSLIYSVALHRQLACRLKGYDYDRHFGGYAYFFVRGMAGKDTPRDPSTGRAAGVFAQRWSRQVIEGLDAALAREVTP
jgi:exodeoxyribonuclease V beta subunit